MDNIKEKYRQGYYFNIEITLRYAFEIIKRDAFVIATYSTIYIILAMMLIRWEYWGMFVMAIITGPFVGGYLLAFRKSANGQKLTFNDFLEAFYNPVPTIMINLVTGIITAIGTYFFILPGVYFYIALLFTIPFTVFFNMNILEALESSLMVITKKWLNFFLLMLILLIINVLGAIPYGLGLIFTFPFTYAAIFVSFVNIFPEVIDIKENEEDNSVTPDMFR